MTSKQLLLERQAWALRIRLNQMLTAESKGFAVKYSTPIMKRKLLRLITLSNHRWLRRQSKLFNYQFITVSVAKQNHPHIFKNSGDLCRSPVVQSPDVLGQGSTKHFNQPQGRKESPLSITSGLLRHGVINS